MDYKINIDLLHQVFDHMHLKPTPYVFGQKAPSLKCDSNDITGIDCSGFVRYAIARASSQKTILPDGSQAQWEWFRNQANNQVADYKTAAKVKDKLFICFIKETSSPGHVWLMYNGFTMESHGGAGVSSRSWDTPVLARNCCAVYQIG